MHIRAAFLRRSLTGVGALSALGLIGAAPALAATSVSVRVEALSKTLLPATTVTAPASGSITTGGTPSGQCPADSAAGALNAATHGKWNGTYSKGLGIDISSILGTTYSYSKGDYWSIFVNDRYATKGICDLKLKAGDQLLFAPEPKHGTDYPIVLKTPATASVGTPVQVKAYYYPGQGSKTKPVKGVSFSGTSATTNADGVATITPTKPGSLKLVGVHSGFIRSALDTIKVSK